MKFGEQVALFLGALFVAQQTTAFVPASRIHSSKGLAFIPESSIMTSTSRAVPSLQGSSTCLFAYDDDDDEDDDEEDELNPLGKGVDSVSWLPSVVGKTKSAEISNIQDGTEVLPLFPLGGFVYTPNTEHVLNIFEPRYRQMYTDILMNGTKRFCVVTSHPSEQGRFAQTGVLFELEDLKEVSEQTADQIKYICNHKVTGRVTIHKVLNPEAWETRDTYLKAVATIHDDSGKDDEETAEVASNDVYGAVAAAAKGSPSKAEEDLRDSFRELVDIQHELEEDVRFTQDAVKTLAVKDGSSADGLWQTVRLWQSFVDQRLMAAQNELQKDFQERLQEFLKKEKGFKNDEIPSAIGFSDLSPELQDEVQKIQKRMEVELRPLLLESSLTMQKILEADGHKERLSLLKYFMNAETRRLQSKKTLKGIFSGDSSSVTAEEPAAPPSKSKEEKSSKDGSKSEDESNPSFFDEPDAFQ
ncbi:unnamed protein product [Cylindrotheca closterium]|uniref:Lon N-terminal domain-containing protein n=1 Tax=Cylindrotheca closterium TaxID=2856 RepID=A0AAD2G1P4_9STRA|nr:unnamed protein product [Cylindrotheca closterium]